MHSYKSKSREKKKHMREHTVLYEWQKYLPFTFPKPERFLQTKPPSSCGVRSGTTPLSPFLRLAIRSH